MASKHSKIKVAIEELKSFLDYYSEDYSDAEKNINYGQGWHIPFYENELFILLNNLVHNLYEGLYPKLMDENPATDEEIVNSILSIIEYLKQNIDLFRKIIQKKQENGDEAILSTVEGTVQELVSKALYKLTEFISIVNKETPESIKTTNAMTEKFDIAIITALNETEFEELLKIPVTIESFNVVDDPTDYRKCTIGNASVLLATDDTMGMAAATSLTTKLIAKFEPKYIIMAGIAGGVKDKEKNYGDILIARWSFNYESGKYKYNVEKQQSVFEPNPEQVEMANSFLAKVNRLKLNRILLNKIADGFNEDEKNIKPKTHLKVFIGPVASGSAVIADSKRIDKIRAGNRKLIGIDMETFGVMYASKAFSNKQTTKAISVKSISDFADQRKSDKYRRYAAYTSAIFIYHLILQELQNE